MSHTPATIDTPLTESQKLRMKCHINVTDMIAEGTGIAPSLSLVDQVMQHCFATALKLLYTPDVLSNEACRTLMEAMRK